MIANLRDLGGVTTTDNKKIKPDLIYRSANLSDLSADDIKALKNLKIKTIIDFRTADEISQAADTDVYGIDYLNIDIFKNNNAVSPSMENLAQFGSQIEDFMAKVYESFVLDEGALAGYREYLNLLLNKDDATFIFHCTFGKDRTGWAAALFLKLLDASDEDIFRDYLTSNIALRDFNEKLIEGIQKQYQMSDADINKLKPAFEVNEAFLQSSFDQIDQHYGSFDSFVSDALHFTADDIAQLKAIYVE